MSAFLSRPASRASARFLLLAVVAASGALAWACSSDADPSGTTGDGGVIPTDGSTSSGRDGSATDGGSPATDAGQDAARPVPEAGLCDLESKRPTNGDAGAGSQCIFNWDCRAGLQCSSQDNGTCLPGSRGTLCAFAPCTKSEDCASGACVETTGGKKACTIDCDPEASICQTPLGKCNAVVQVCIPEN